MEASSQATHAPAADAVKTRVFAFNLLPLKALNQPKNGPKFSTEQQAAEWNSNSPLKAAKAGTAAGRSSSSSPSTGAQQFLQQLSTSRAEAMELLSDTGSSAGSVEAAVNRCGQL
jgi:hypothetical protein